MKKRKSAGQFMASIYRIWMLRYVDVPEDVLLALTQKNARGLRGKKNRALTRNYIPVVARVNGRAVRTTLLPAGGGHHRLQFNADLRKAARADVGDVVRIELAPDRESRDIAVPADLRAALKRHPRRAKHLTKLRLDFGVNSRSGWIPPKAQTRARAGFRL